MTQFPVFPEAPPKTLEELEEQIHDTRLLGMGFLVVGFTLLSCGLIAVFFDKPPEVGLIGSGGGLLFIGMNMLMVIPPILRARWVKRVRHL